MSSQVFRLKSMGLSSGFSLCCSLILDGTFAMRLYQFWNSHILLRYVKMMGTIKYLDSDEVYYG